MKTVEFLNAVYGADVGMIDGGEQPRFAIEARQPLRFGRKNRWENLDCHVTPQRAIAAR